MTSRGMRSCLAALLAATLAPQVREARADDDDGPETIKIRSLSAAKVI